ncbi:MAG: hypothetical protein F4246_03740 [Rhodothermaceae bacterium]|nr:hypothetical protein [Rhodothermaceae bacterium]MXX58557.1 hypothetical protein [Rhodothermaceae bacterium]MYD19149.1 hypothetical protein [Rhodothermaceae bacterium]MYD56108.1 hypothetical protein [Rhodothermaceae bacterium]MYI43130.1 hypothetical protein [Rhodothermaceae bacterium]
MARTYSVTISVYEDGTLAITDSDITGLIIEVSSTEELLAELPRVASELLRLNHGLTDKEIAEAALIPQIIPVDDSVHQQITTALLSLPRQLGACVDHSHSPQYA